VKSRTSALLVAIGLVLAVHTLLAHHSAAMFDDAKVIELTGVVKEMQWANPHIWIQLVVDENGAKKEWSLEGGSPNTLSRRGWRSTTFKPGDVVTARLNPMKDGTAAGLFVGAKFASDGHTIGRWD
jgi:hypothetical protein